jgi:alkanesulfonate monooxygenase SsuD/methylene tetrahydromethanopterin reductase-like flavin-dependent oxidoreductase (luciferase family)
VTFDSNRHAACIDAAGRAPIESRDGCARRSRFDLRVPSFARTSVGDDMACLEMCEWADGLGIDAVAISEHHGVDDGYMSSPVTLAAAIAARTKRARINIAAVLVPLHDPLRLAEQLATAAIIADGRLSVVAGMGYRPEEFTMAGVDRTQRGKLFDEYVGVLQQAWTGEPFTWRGRTVQVTPKPYANGPGLLLGGSSEVAARRAARIADGFIPSVPEVWDFYRDAAYYRAPRRDDQPASRFVHVTRDPEATGSGSPHALHDARSYPTGRRRSAQVHVDAVTEDDVKKSSVYKVVTPEGASKSRRSSWARSLHPLMGGIEPELDDRPGSSPRSPLKIGERAAARRGVRTLAESGVAPRPAAGYRALEGRSRPSRLDARLRARCRARVATLCGAGRAGDAGDGDESCSSSSSSSCSTHTA